MRKTVLLTVTLMLNLVFLVLADEGFTIELRNTRQTIINYDIMQLDHGFPDWPGPATVMGGELESGQHYVSPYSRHFGKYIVHWYSHDQKYDRTLVFTVRPPSKKIIIYCDKVVCQ